MVRWPVKHLEKLLKAGNRGKPKPTTVNQIIDSQRYKLRSM